MRSKKNLYDIKKTALSHKVENTIHVLLEYIEKDDDLNACTVDNELYDIRDEINAFEQWKSDNSLIEYGQKQI